MHSYLIKTTKQSITPIYTVIAGDYKSWLAERSDRTRAWLDANGFTGKEGQHITLPDEDGQIEGILFMCSANWDIWSLASLPEKLPTGVYGLDTELTEKQATDVAAGWLLGTYQFTRYKKSDKKFATLLLPKNADGAMALRIATATTIVRDLINTPAADMGPRSLERAALQIAGEFEARSNNILGEDLLTYHFPMIHAVGRAASEAPRLIDLSWGNKEHPKVTLVGKGVCFDSGGLDIKSASNMLLMKKDMGGAATVLGLAHMIMDAGLPVRLRILIPAVENAIASNAYRPGDILTSRSGKTVEVGNTDAEGRLVLSDALTCAAEDKPDLIADFATLTGAARVAIGGEIAATFTDDDDLWQALEASGKSQSDPVWRLPIWADYRAMLDSKVADINNVSSSGLGGATTAALFLKEFVGNAKSWVHFDIMAYNAKDRPGRPIGGEAMAMRAMFDVIQNKFGS